MRDLESEVRATMDHHGVIGQVGHEYLKSGIDGGDSVNRMGHYTFLIRANWIKCDFNKFKNMPLVVIFRTIARKSLSKFESKEHPGNYMRHFDPEAGQYGTVAYCEGTWKGVMSRDQFIPVLISLGYHGEYAMLWRIFKAHLKRGLLFTNNTVGNGQDWRVAKKKIPDLTGPEFLALYIRGFWPYSIMLWPLLFLFDIETLIGSVIWRNRTKDPNKDDVLNHCSVSIYGRLRMPTLTMWAACKINSYQLMSQKLRHYWCHWRKSCYFVDLYNPLIKKYFGR